MRIIAACCLALLLVAPAAAQEDPIAAGDALYAQREDVSKALAAVERYSQAAKDPALAKDAFWRIARARYWIGTVEPDEAKAAQVFSDGVEWGKKAVEAAPDDAAGHYWLGVCYAKFGEAKGVLKSLSLVDPIKAEMQAVIRLDRSTEHGGAYRVLGKMYNKLPGLFGGSDKKAKEMLDQAIAIDPANLSNHLYLGEFYLATKKRDEARKALQLVVDLPAQPDRAGEDKLAKEQARKLLSGL